MDIHSAVPQPHTLLVAVPETNVYFTILDLKDVLFGIPVDKAKQSLSSNGRTPRQEEGCSCVGLCFLKGSKPALVWQLTDGRTVVREQ